MPLRGDGDVESVGGSSEAEEGVVNTDDVDARWSAKARMTFSVACRRGCLLDLRVSQAVKDISFSSSPE